jgi:hypothetical protein
MAENLTTNDLAGTTGRDDEAARDEVAEAPIARDPASDETSGDSRRDDGGRDTREPLLDAPEASSFTERWREVQVDFVDRPRESVEQADALVAELMQRLASGSPTSGAASSVNGTEATTSRRRIFGSP